MPKFVNLLLEKTWNITNNDQKFLINQGFYLHKKDGHDGFYTYRFPVHKYKKYTTLECKLILIEGETSIKIDVYDESGAFYNPFYFVEYGDYGDIVYSINKKILAEFRKLGIKEDKNGK